MELIKMSFQKFISELFLSLESFLKKASELNIFDALTFHYQIKLSNMEKCDFQVAGNFIQLCNELQNALKEIINAFSMGYKLKTSRALDVPLTSVTTVPTNEVIVTVPQNSSVVSTCTDSIVTTTAATMESTSTVSTTFSGVCSVQNQDTTLLQDRTNSPHDTAVTEWVAKSPVITKQKTKKTLSSANVKENDTAPEPEHKVDVINKSAHFKCYTCIRKFRTRYALSKHICKSSPPHATVPSHCDEISKCIDDPCNKTNSAASENNNVNKLPVFVCSECFTTYCQMEMFEQHICKEQDEENGKPELVTSIQQLEAMKRFICGICCEVYRSYARIMYHVARCRSGPYDCELCNIKFVNKQVLNRHKKKCHKGVESFFCEECGQGFQLRASLQKHLVNRHENAREMYFCDVADCKASYKKRIYLTNHKITYHKIERKYLCQVCGNKFLSQQSLTYHLDAHSEKDKYKCHICSKVLRTKEKLTFHVRIHTGERPFVCETCAKSFISKYKLDEHQRRHRGEKQYKCDACNKAYANKFDLKKHIRRFPEGTHYSKTCPNIGTTSTDKKSVNTTKTAVVTTATKTVSIPATVTTIGASCVATTSSTDSSVNSTASTTVNIIGSSSTSTSSSTVTIMNTSMTGSNTSALAHSKPELSEDSTTTANLNSTIPVSEVNYTVTKSSTAKTTLSATNKNTVSEQVEAAGLENNSAHVNSVEQLGASGSTPTHVFVQPVNNCPSRVVVHLDNAGQIIPLSVPVHFLDPNIQFFQADPVQVIQTVTVPSQNILNSYDNSTL